MDVSTIKAIGDLGLGFGSLVALVFVIVYQMKIMAKMSDNIQENTKATAALTFAVNEGNKVDSQVVSAMNGCRLKQSIRNN